MSKNLESLIDNFLRDPLFSRDFIREVFLNISEAIIFVDNKGTIFFANEAAKILFRKEIHNIKEIGYLFNFDICILDQEQDIISYSPLSVILESTINTKVHCDYEPEPGIEKQISIISKYIPENKYLLIFSIEKGTNITQSYIELAEANQKLKEKIKENEQLRSQAQSQAIRETLVNRISNAIRNSLEIDTILQTAVDELGKTLGTDRTILIQTSEGETEFPITHEYTSEKQTKLKDTRIKIEEDFFLQEVFETHEAASGNHVDQWDKTSTGKFKLIVPVIHHEELFGLIMMIRKNRKWHSEEISLVQSIADQISVSIKNAKLFEDTTSKNVKISVLNEILKSINASLILDDVFYTIGREIRRLINFDRGSIAILDENTKQVKLFARLTKTGNVDILRSGPLIAKGTAISWAIENLKPIKIDMSEEEQFADILTLKKSGIKSAIIIPMINKGVVTGIFYIGSNIANIYSEAEVEIMTQIAGQISVAVENAKLYWQTQTQAMKETLINQIVSSIRKSLNLKEVLQSTVNELGQTLAVDNCLLKYYLEESNDTGIYEYTSKDNQSIIISSEKLFRDIVKHINFKKDTITIFNAKDNIIDKHIKDFIQENNLTSILLLPITFKEPLSNEEIKVGLIVLTNSSKEKSWSSDDINLLRVLSDQITITINQSRLFEQSQKQKQELEIALLKLKEAQSQLVQSEKMAGLGQLVAGVAHEINTPIGSINSNNSIFKKCTEKIEHTLKEEPLNAEKINQLLQVLKESIRVNSIACERINEIVKSLKNFARLDESEIKKVNIHDGLSSTLTLLRHELKERIQIITDYSKLPEVECYPNLLNQVFMNLLVNAVQSINNKGTITIKTWHTEDNINISISDTGLGINESNMKKIFDPGFTTKGVGVGTGLGLSICYQIIEKHKGQIKVESISGRGSTFTVIIPARQQ